MHLMAGRADAATLAAHRLAALFSGRFYLELQRTGEARDAACTQASLALALRQHLPVVATHPIQFLAPDDFRAHEARFCIAEGYTLADPRRPRPFTREQYVAKFRTLAADVLEEAEVERFLDLAQRLPELTADEVARLTIVAAPGVLASVESPRGLF